MFLVIEENENCESAERVFPISGKKKPVRQVQVETPEGKLAWCEVVGVEDSNTFLEAHAIEVEDSGAGMAWLVFGGSWGLRFRRQGESKDWSLADSSQWGEAFKVLDGSGEDIRF
ncbi:hypothetical protein BVX98_06265 [bacterium F11]|nr:hypothetical protein BVX98_06265 [bacterium F11]